MGSREMACSCPYQGFELFSIRVKLGREEQDKDPICC